MLYIDSTDDRLLSMLMLDSYSQHSRRTAAATTTSASERVNIGTCRISCRLAPKSARWRQICVAMSGRLFGARISLTRPIAC
jgi:hypothetical protein